MVNYHIQINLAGTMRGGVTASTGCKADMDRMKKYLAKKVKTHTAKVVYIGHGPDDFTCYWVQVRLDPREVD